MVEREERVKYSGGGGGEGDSRMRFFESDKRQHSFKQSFFIVSSAFKLSIGKMI